MLLDTNFLPTMQLTDPVTGKVFAWDGRFPNVISVFPRHEPETLRRAESVIPFQEINPVSGIPGIPALTKVVSAYLRNASQRVG